VENDEHPPSNVQVGQNFTAGIINSLFKSPNWSSSVLFLTYDEHGGFYDGVVPPKAVAPDSIPPMYQSGDVPGGFDQYGIRVPVAVISPYSKPHYVSHDVYDHTSILRFIEMRFGLPNLTQRDLAANPMRDFFDFSEPSFAQPPVLPAAVIDPAQLAACASMPSNTGI
jgi:phospholipase C